MRVAVLCNYPFPEGLAATTRIRTYLKGLAEIGVEVDVFVYNPTTAYCSDPKYPDNGSTEEGIQYHYPNGRKFGKSKLSRIIGIKLYNKIRTCYCIYRESKRKKIDFLFIANDYLSLLYLAIPFCHLIRIAPIFITDEYPEPIRIFLKNKIPRWKKYAYNFILLHVKGAVFMTESLERYFNLSGRIPTHVMPTITDTSRFSDCLQMPIERKYLCYMGNMELSKDNVDNIIEAFARICDRYPKVDLHLYGSPAAADRMKIETLIVRKELSTRVFLKGRVDFFMVPNILYNAIILVSSQPDTKRAEGGFPTKLGEYLATGKPVLLTDVGEISRYIQNEVHAYIVPPEDPEAYAVALSQILDNYASALAVGETGRKYLYNTFDYRIISRNLLRFLNRVKNGN